MREAVVAEVIIKGGIVVDGSGATGFPADVALAAGKIVALGDLDSVPLYGDRKSVV